jgi:hypothetical protein
MNPYVKEVKELVLKSGNSPNLRIVEQRIFDNVL